MKKCIKSDNIKRKLKKYKRKGQMRNKKLIHQNESMLDVGYETKLKKFD